MNESVQQWGERLVILANFYEFDNPTKGIRESKKAETGNKVESRKSYSETNSQLVREAKRLRRVNLLAKKRISFQNIAEELDTLGYEVEKDARLTAKQVQL